MGWKEGPGSSGYRSGTCRTRTGEWKPPPPPIHLRPTGLQAIYKGNKMKIPQTPGEPGVSTESHGPTSEPILHLIHSPQLPQKCKLRIPGTERPSEAA